MIPSNDNGVRFTTVTAADLPLLRSWMMQPHWRAWWGDPDEEIGMIVDMIEGRDTTRPYLFAFDGPPVGYIQAWFVGFHQTPDWIETEPWLLDLPAEAVGVDISIGDAADLSKGIGSRVLRAFVEGLAAEGHRRIIIDPHRDNARAIAAYRKAGFRPDTALAGRTGDVLIMFYDPGHDSHGYRVEVAHHAY